MSDFTGMTKHVGMLNNTGKNVVVVYMRLPGDPNHALVVDTDALPDSYNEALRRIVESTEGQQSKDLADVLGRRMSPDGSNTTLLQKFHGAGRLQKVPVNLISMTPRKGVRLPLTEVLRAIDSSKEDEPLGFDELDPETRAAVAADLKRFNVHASNFDGETSANRRDEAVSLIRQAELLESDAQNMRMRAYKMDPSLRKNIGKTAEKPVATQQVVETLEPIVPAKAPKVSKASKKATPVVESAPKKAATVRKTRSKVA